jgi:hypothetical protein
MDILENIKTFNFMLFILKNNNYLLIFLLNLQNISVLDSKMEQHVLSIILHCRGYHFLKQVSLH